MLTDYEDFLAQIRYPGKSLCMLEMFKTMNEDYQTVDIPEDDAPDET